VDEATDPIVRWPAELVLLADGSALRFRSTLTADDFRSRLRGGDVTIGVIDLGQPIRWTAGSDGVDLWRSEIKPHLIDAEAQIHLDEMPDGYCYTASLWTDATAGVEAVICLKNH
jgi:hypothetical protein